MKKLVAVGLTAVMAAAGLGALSACGGDDESFKVGFICLHDESSTYDKNFIDAAKAAAKTCGLKDSQVIIKTNIDEKEVCYETAADLADQGCDLVFADSFGHESFMLKAAKEYKYVEFCHATGTQAHTANVANFHNAFATIYEGRYLAGVVAGMKLKSMIDAGDFTAAQAKIGYVGAFPYAEVVSGYTSFYLGAKSVVPEVTMEVRYTNEWYHLVKEKDTANALINNGCKLISQHADSTGAPSACEEAGVPNVSYNGSTESTGPNTYLVSSKINWEPYFEYIINQAKGKESMRTAAVEAGSKIEDVDTHEFDIDTDWTGTLATNSVQLTTLNSKAGVIPEGTQAKLDEVTAKLKNGTLHVFDTNNFTVKGEKVTTYLADVDDDGKFVGETEAIKDGYFHESEYRSAPYFDLRIDGITEIEEEK